MDVDAQADQDTWNRLEAEYRNHLMTEGFPAPAIDAVCSRMEQHFQNADVEFGVWGKMPIPDGVTPKQANEITGALTEIVERMAVQVQQHTKRMMWNIFELEIMLETARTRDPTYAANRRGQRH